MTAPSASVMDLVFGYMPAQVMYAAADLRVADLLARGSRTSRELAEQSGARRRRDHPAAAPDVGTGQARRVGCVDGLRRAGWAGR